MYIPFNFYKRPDCYAALLTYHYYAAVTTELSGETPQITYTPKLPSRRETKLSVDLYKQCGALEALQVGDGPYIDISDTLIDALFAALDTLNKSKTKAATIALYLVSYIRYFHNTQHKPFITSLSRIASECGTTLAFTTKIINLLISENIIYRHYVGNGVAKRGSTYYINEIYYL